MYTDAANDGFASRCLVLSELPAGCKCHLFQTASEAHSRGSLVRSGAIVSEAGAVSVLRIRHSCAESHNAGLNSQPRALWPVQP